jgi:hypothetical protein
VLQYGGADVYLRVVNQARANAESLSLVNPDDVSRYQDPADVSRSRVQQYTGVFQM